MELQKDFTRLIDSNLSLVAINTSNQLKIIDQFKLNYRRNGQATYLWSYGSGLHRCDASHITIPGTESFSEALEFILTSHHFGIYLLQSSDFKNYGSPNILRLKKIARHANKASRLTLMLGEHMKFPEDLQKYIPVIEHHELPLDLAEQAPIPVNPFMLNHPAA